MPSPGLQKAPVEAFQYKRFKKRQKTKDKRKKIKGKRESG